MYLKNKPKNELVELDLILEELFNRGYKHGIEGGLSTDGETYAVMDAKTEICKLIYGDEK